MERRCPFGYQGATPDHLAIHHRNDPHLCVRCRTHFDSEYDLTAHVLCLHEKKDFICEQVFVSHAEISNHIRVIHRRFVRLFQRIFPDALSNGTSETPI